MILNTSSQHSTRSRKINFELEDESVITAHQQPRSANLVVIIIKPLRFDELVQLWCKHLSGLIRSAWVKDLLGCDPILQPPPPPVTFSGGWFIHLPHSEHLKSLCPYFWQQVISSPSERSVWRFVLLLAAHIKKQIATCLLWQAVKSFVKLLPRSCSSQ